MHPASRKPAIRAVGVAALLTLLAGCDLANRQARATILYQEGCVFYVEGISSEQAAAMSREWSLEQGCNVQVITESESKNIRSNDDADIE